MSDVREVLMAAVVGDDPLLLAVALRWLTVRPPQGGVADLPSLEAARAAHIRRSTVSVSARFWVQKITKQAASQGNITRIVELAPVVRPSQLPGADGNVDWSKYTPSGSISLTVSANAAGEWFESMLGQDVAITFAPVDPVG